MFRKIRAKLTYTLKKIRRDVILIIGTIGSRLWTWAMRKQMASFTIEIKETNNSIIEFIQQLEKE